MIPITKPFLPPLKEYEQLLQGIWKRNWLTNNGPLLNEYEIELKSYLNVEHLLCVGNGTLALQLAFRALNLSGKVITTPFSYVATTSSLVWEGLQPVFVDIDPHTYNIDPFKIEEAIDPETTAILATHCFGNACDIEAIEVIARKHNLKVIYDASHCFGTLYKGKSIFDYGDISTLSLHATKPVHMVEGGAVFTQDPELLRKMALLRNFGHDGMEQFDGVGINAKNSEFHAAMGLAVLKHADAILESRSVQSNRYFNWLQDEEIQFQKVQENCHFNYAYFSVVFKNEETLLKVNRELGRNGITARRYFYPGLNTLDYVNGAVMPVSDEIAARVLCLPLYLELTEEEQLYVVRIIKRALRY